MGEHVRQVDQPPCDTVARMLPRLVPFYVAMIVLLLTTYLPALSLTLPGWLGAL